MADHLFREERFPWILWARLFFSLAVLVFSARGPVPVVALLGLWAATCLLNLRSAFGLDGAYQMTVIVLSGVTLASLLPSDSVSRALCLYFIAAQLVLSYVVAGLAKVLSPVWRGGTALPGVFATRIYGNRLAWTALRRWPTAAKAGCWVVIGCEVLFPLVMLDYPPLTLFVVTLGLAFHASTAILMGLNGFFLSFAAAYPALLFMIDSLR